MRRIFWRVILPILQVTVAATLLVYGWYEHRAKLEAVGAVELSWEFQHYPSPAQRVAYAVSYPAFVLTNAAPVAEHTGFYLDLFHWRIKDSIFTFTVGDVQFLVGVGILWFWVGLMLDRLGSSVSPGQARSPLRLGLSLIFALAISYSAFVMIRSIYRPEMQIGAFGLVWSVLLIEDFVWRVIRARRAPSPEHARST